jgi:alcohol dehydrogenase class IV
VLLATGSARACASRLLPYPLLDYPEQLHPKCRTLIVAGGGRLLDQAKYLRATARPDVRLIAMPSIWGSGAERSRIVVLENGGAKDIHVGDQFLPDAYVYCREFMASIPEWRARYACGDAWAHALEAFLSPLAGPQLREAAAVLLRRMTELPSGTNEGWFEASGNACALQADSSVGLIHGISHTLEAPLTSVHTEAFWGHSRLCSLFLYPVLMLNQSLSPKPAQLFSQYEVDCAAVTKIARDLFDPKSYAQALPLLIDYWPSVLRDRCTRTNVSLVRSSSLRFFMEFV